MAKQRFGINDGYRGAVGTVIGYMWRGRWCLRARPRVVRNPRTELQQAGRTVFGAASALAAGMSQALCRGLGDASRKAGMTARNLFISLNRRHLRAGADGVAVDYPSLTLAAGPVAPVAFATPVLDGELLAVAFEADPLCGRACGDDTVYLFAWCPAAGAALLSAPAPRRSRSVALSLPAEWQGLAVHLYGFVTDCAGRASASAYVGEVLLPLPEENPAETPLPVTSASTRSAEISNDYKSAYYKTPYIRKRKIFNLLR